MIQSLPLPIFLIMLAFPLAMTGICVYAGIFARQRAALVKEVMTSQIRTAKPGYVEFSGKVEAVEQRTLTAPLTQSPCCWYHIRVEKYDKRAGKKSADWITVRDESSEAPFFVRDATGVCAVDPSGAEVTPTDKSLWYGATEEPEDRNPPRVGPMESAKGWVEISGGPNSKYRYSEERIYDGDRLFVLGVFSNTPPEPEEDDIEDVAVDGEDFEAEPDAPEEEDTELDIADEIHAAAARVTPNRMARGSRKQPLILSTTEQQVHIDMMAKGGLAAFFVALFPLALVILLLWARFG